MSKVPVLIIALVIVAVAAQKADTAPAVAAPAPKMASTTPDFEREIQWQHKYQRYYPMSSKAFDKAMWDYVTPNWA